MLRMMFEVPPIIVYPGPYVKPLVTSVQSSASAPKVFATKSATLISCSVQKHFVAAEKPVGAWRSTLACDQDAAEPVADLKSGDLLPDARIARVSTLECEVVQGFVRDKSVDAATFVFELNHRLFEGVALDTDEVDSRHASVGEVHLAEVTVGGHVGDWTDLDAGRVHRDDDLADTPGAAGQTRRCGR